MTNTKVTVTAVRDDDRDNNNKLERKIAIATDGLQPQFIRKLKHRDTTKNTETICDYIIAMNAKINPSLMHKANQITVLR